MSNISRIKWNMGTFRGIRHDPVAAAIVDGAAQRGAAFAGDGYEAGSFAAKSRHRGSIITATPRAMRDNAKNHTLARVIDAL